MKLKTHDIFSTGVLTVIGSFFTIPIYALIGAVFISFASNHIIDALGHTKNGMGIPVRTYKTHSPLRGFICGFIPALILFITFYYLKGRYYYSFLIINPDFLLIQGAFAGALHLFIDLPTEGGIFIKRNGRFQRVTAGRLNYNNFIANTVLKAAGLFLIFYVFKSFFRRYI